MKTYKGWRTNPEEKTVSEVVVQIHADGAYYKDLDPSWSQKVYNHSPTGFNWGYGGSGPAQLALAILLDHTGDSGQAVMYHQRFKQGYVAGWGDSWEISQSEIQEFLDAVKQAEAQAHEQKSRR